MSILHFNYSNTSCRCVTKQTKCNNTKQGDVAGIPLCTQRRARRPPGGQPLDSPHQDQDSRSSSPRCVLSSSHPPPDTQLTNHLAHHHHHQPTPTPPTSSTKPSTSSAPTPSSAISRSKAPQTAYSLSSSYLSRIALRSSALNVPRHHSLRLERR